MLLPFCALIYLGLVMKKYSLEGYSDLVTNDFLLLGEQRRRGEKGHVGLPAHTAHACACACAVLAPIPGLSICRLSVESEGARRVWISSKPADPD